MYIYIYIYIHMYICITLTFAAASQQGTPAATVERGPRRKHIEITKGRRNKITKNDPWAVTFIPMPMPRTGCRAKSVERMGTVGSWQNFLGLGYGYEYHSSLWPQSTASVAAMVRRLDIRSKQRDPNPKDNSLITKDTST